MMPEGGLEVSPKLLGPRLSQLNIEIRKFRLFLLKYRHYKYS